MNDRMTDRRVEVSGTANMGLCLLVPCDDTLSRGVKILDMWTYDSPMFSYKPKPASYIQPRSDIYSLKIRGAVHLNLQISNGDIYKKE